MCIEINLSQLVVGKVCLDGRWYKIEYEGLHIICAECGCYGHYSRDCNKPVSTSSSSVSEVQPAAGLTAVDGEIVPPRNPTVSSEIHGQDIQTLRGDWLTVSRKKQAKSRRDQAIKSAEINKDKGSRFRGLDTKDNDLRDDNVKEHGLHESNGNLVNKDSKGVYFKVKQKKVAPTKSYNLELPAKDELKKKTKNLMKVNVQQSKIEIKKIGPFGGELTKGSTSRAKSNDDNSTSLIRRTTKREPKIKIFPGVNLREPTGGVRKLVGTPRLQQKSSSEPVSKELVMESLPLLEVPNVILNQKNQEGPKEMVDFKFHPPDAKASEVVVSTINTSLDVNTAMEAEDKIGVVDSSL